METRPLCPRTNSSPNLSPSLSRNPRQSQNRSPNPVWQKRTYPGRTHQLRHFHLLRHHLHRHHVKEVTVPVMGILQVNVTISAKRSTNSYTTILKARLGSRL